LKIFCVQELEHAIVAIVVDIVKIRKWIKKFINECWKVFFEISIGSTYNFNPLHLQINAALIHKSSFRHCVNTSVHETENDFDHRECIELVNEFFSCGVEAFVVTVLNNWSIFFIFIINRWLCNINFAWRGYILFQV
jgi:hypothetical protein